MCQFANVSCGGIQALADRGYLQVGVRNAGYIDASFTVTVGISASDRSQHWCAVHRQNPQLVT